MKHNLVFDSASRPSSLAPLQWVVATGEILMSRRRGKGCGECYRDFNTKSFYKLSVALFLGSGRRRATGRGTSIFPFIFFFFIFSF